VSKMWCTSTV